MNEKAKPEAHWAGGLLLLGIILFFIGIVLPFISVNEKIYVYSDDYYDYYTTITTYPYAELGTIIFIVGAILCAIGIIGSPLKTKPSES